MQRLLFIQRFVSIWKWTSWFKKAEVWQQGIGPTAGNHRLLLSSKDTDIILEFHHLNFSASSHDIILHV